jgi:hypothetical protein
VAALDHGIEPSDFIEKSLKPTGEKLWKNCGNLHPEMEVSCGNRCQVAKYWFTSCLAFVPLETHCTDHIEPSICYEDESSNSCLCKKLGEKGKRGG